MHVVLYVCIKCAVHYQEDATGGDKSSHHQTDGNSRYVHTHTCNSHGLWLTTDHRNLFCENLEVQFRLKIIKHYCYTLH